MKKAFAILVRVIQLVVLPLVVYVQLVVQDKVLMVSFEVKVMGMLQTLVDLLDLTVIVVASELLIGVNEDDVVAEVQP